MTTTSPENNGVVHSQQVDTHPTNNSQPEYSEIVKPEQVEPEPMDMEASDPSPMGEQVDTQSPAADIGHPEPLGEDVYSPTGAAEHMDSQLGADHIHSEFRGDHVHTEPVDSEFEGEHVHTEPVASEFEGENVHAETVDSEHMHHQQVASADIGHTEPVSEEMVHIHGMSSEMDHTQTVSAEMAHPQMVTAEMVDPQMVTSATLVHSEPLGSEFDHTQPINSEHGHYEHGALEAIDLGSSQGHGNDLMNSNGMELVNVTQPLSTDVTQATPDTQPGKRRKKKSIVWEHFTIETVSAGCRRACCKVCKQSFAYSTGSKVAGTSHLKRHIAKGTCPVILRQQEKNQLSPYLPKSGGPETATAHQPKRRYRSSGSPYLIFDQDRCRQEIARMIIMHDYPLHMVEHPGFVSFVQNLQPRFDMVSFNIVQGDCVGTFLREKQNLVQFIGGIPGRICLTLDMWTSPQSTGFVFVTGQFIDNDWKLHRRLLNVVMEPFPESDAAFSHAIGTCLSDWNLDRKLASITFNQPLTETGLEKLRALLAVKNPMLLNGQLLIKNCIARTLSSMSQEVLEAGRGIIKKIRTSVKYVKTSESHEEKFVELKQQLQVPSEKSLSLDNVTQWNTTFEMLVAAAELKQVFSCLDTCDPEYKDAPSMEDWKEVENICMYLKLLHDTANILTSKTASSSHVFFHEVWKIQLELARAAASDDLFVSGVAKMLQDKFLKYFKNACLILAIAVAMDPRFKMKLVEFSFTKIFVDEAPVYIRVVDDGMHELFHEYMNPTYTEDSNGGSVKTEDQQEANLLTSNGLTDFDMYIMETSSQQMKSELDQYLEESLLPRVQDFDVLGWWKLNKIKYPILSKMARDILSIPLSTVPADSVFDTIPKEMDSYRCSLRPETVEALICAKDWLQQETPKGSKDMMKMEL